MSLENKLLQKLAEAKPAGERHELTISEGAWTAHLTYDRRDELSGRLWEIALHRNAVADGDVQTWAERITKRVDYSKGTPENPLSEAEIERKFLSLAGAAIGRAQSESLLVEVNRTLDAETIAPLANSLGRCRITGRL